MSEAPAATATPVTFEALSARHLQLLEAQAEDRLNAPDILSFIEDAAAAGTQIESVSDRDSLRAILSYWSGTLSRLQARPAQPSPVPPPPSAEGLEPVGAEAPADEAPAGAAPPDAPPVPRPVLATFDATQAPTLDESANPFVGLAAFDINQSANFCGRDRAVQDLLQHVMNAPLVVVSGASGTGKSSLVRAGLTHALEIGPGTAGWLVVVMTPGRDPVASLAAALAPASADRDSWIDQARARIEADPDAAAQFVAESAGTRSFVLIVDQMEELFSLARPDDRDRADKAFAAIAALPNAHLVVTIRDEYLESERRAPLLHALDVRDADEFRVPPLDLSEIREAILTPATRAGLVFQDGVVDRLVSDMGTDPAALPLLQYTLLQLWKRRQGNRITMEVYNAVGGPATALSDTAQEIYDGFGSAQARENTRIIFQQLVRPSLLFEFVRDRVSRAELERLLPPASIDTVLKPFVDAALIRVTRGADRSDDRIEIVHEALIRNWRPLRDWALEVRESERAILALDVQAQRWAGSGRTLGHLLLGKALTEGQSVYDAYVKRARVDPLVEARVKDFLVAGHRVQRNLWIALAAAAGVGLVLLLSVAGLSLSNWKLGSDVALNNNTIAALSNQAGVLSEKASALQGLADESGADDDAARQYIQMLLSRGTISADDLPAAFADMTPRAATVAAGRWPEDFQSNFLGLGQRLSPPDSLKGVRVALPHMRAFIDEARGYPILVAAQSDRSQPAYMGHAHALFRWPDFAPQWDEATLAGRGLALAPLVDRRDVAWGKAGRQAAEAVNLLPLLFPQRLRGEGSDAFARWPAVGDWMRFNHNPDAIRVLYLSGIVPGAAGQVIPAKVWKIAISVDANGRLVTDAAMLPAPRATAGDLPGRTTVKAIAEATGIDFGQLLQAIKAPPRAIPAPVIASMAQATPALAAAPARVFIEINNVDSAVTQAIASALGSQSFGIPPVQTVDPCIGPPELRYYFPQDAAAAARAAGIAGAAIQASLAGDQMVVLKRLDPNRYKAKPGNLELWLCNLTSANAK
ncbi:MAG: ATP-binding protein [Proteobacteria bacterium]|nr:ATP-binding protein [Pseudomonadota bacterium]